MIFLNPYIDHDPMEARKRKLLNFLLYGIGIVIIIVLFITLFAQSKGVAGSKQEVRQLYLTFVFIIMGWGLVFIVNRYGSRIIASLLFLSLLLFVIGISDEPLRVVDGRTLFMFALPILIASTILKPWASFVFAGLSSLEILIIGMRVQEFPNITAMGGFFILAIISWLSAYTIERTSENLRISNIKLMDSEKKYRSLYESSKDGISFSDTKGNLIDMNQALLNMLGYSSVEEIKKLTYQKLTPEKWHKMEAEIVKNQIMKRGYSDEYEKEYIKKDGTLIPIRIIAWLIKDKQKDTDNIWAITRDITERKRAEENIQKVKSELQTILDSVRAFIFFKDIKSRFIRVNKALANAFQIPVTEFQGKLTEELFPKNQANKMIKDDLEVISSGKPKMGIIQQYDAHDGKRWLLTDKIPYKNEKNQIIGIIGLSADITVQVKSEQKLNQAYEKLKKTMDSIIITISKIIESKDPYTSGHQHRVSQLSILLGEELGIPQNKIEGIRIASLIHDIGKIALPAEILNKSSRLTDIEYSIVKSHPQIGYDILKSIDFSYPIDQIVLQHHEKMDGSGYPQGLKGDEILLEARILVIADVMEAMSSHRPYRPALEIDKALEEISKNKGIFYDSKIVDICVNLFKKKGFKFN